MNRLQYLLESQGKPDIFELENYRAAERFERVRKNLAEHCPGGKIILPVLLTARQVVGR